MSTFTSNVEYLPGVVAGADLSAAANQYKLVKLSAAGTVVLCAATTDEPIGVLCNRPESGEGADVAISGVVKCRSGEAISVGERIGPANDGEGVNTSTSDDYVIGKALTATDNAGEYFSMLLCSPAQIID